MISFEFLIVIKIISIKKSNFNKLNILFWESCYYVWLINRLNEFILANELVHKNREQSPCSREAHNGHQAKNFIIKI